MKTLNHPSVGSVKADVSAKTVKWSKFKDIVMKQPEATAYGAIFTGSTAYEIATGFKPGCPAAGIGLTALTLGAISIAGRTVFSEIMTKKDQTVANILSAATFMATSASLMAHNTAAAGVVSSIGILAMTAYTPVKNLLIAAQYSIKEKAAALGGGAVALCGVAMAAFGVSSNGFGLINLHLTKPFPDLMYYWGAQLGAILIGGSVVALGGKIIGAALKPKKVEELPASKLGETGRVD